MPDDCVNYSGDDGVVYTKNMKTLLLYPPARPGATYDIPSSVEEIATFAFRTAQNITSLTIPSGVSTIGKQAFREMKKLQEVMFAEPSSVKKFGVAPFMHCSLLKEVTLPSSLEQIGNAFYGCTSLEVITVPDGSQLTDIQGSAFTTCTALREFKFEGSCTLKTIGSDAFANLTHLERFDVPQSVTSIARNAFSGCSSLATVTFDENANIKYLRTGAFADCGLTEITIPNSVVSIEKEVFRNCAAMTDVNVSANLTNIDPEAFKYCWKLDNITVDEGNPVYSSVDGFLLTLDKETLVIFPPGKANSNFTLLPPSITKIGNYAFYDCKKLENVVIPNKVTSIGERAFGLCNNLNTVTFLCDDMIDPSNIDQGKNTMSFDDDRVANGNMFTNINTYVRKELLDKYSANSYYQQFNVVGTSFFDNDNEYLPVSQNTVDLLSVGNKDYTFVVPATAKGQVLVNPGEMAEKTYEVRLIGDYAFQNTSADVKEVVVFNNIQYIGARAFMTTTNLQQDESTIENIFFIDGAPTKRMLSTTRFKLRPSDLGASADKLYSEIASTTNIYVKKSAYETYKAIWTDYQEKIDYKVPGISIGTKYGTFSREFDVDLSDCTSSTVYAFTAGEYKLGTGDYGDRTKYMVRMTSINHTGDSPYTSSGDDDGTYIPANSGVLLKVMDENSDATPSDYYYCIGENSKWDNTAYSGETVMNAVTVNSQQVESDGSMYVMSGGQWKKVNAGKTVTMPVHKAYMKLEGVPAGAKVMLVFGNDEVLDIDNGNATGINAVNVNQRPASGTVYYNMQGQRVNQPNKGVFIKDGRKVIKK